MTHNNAQIRWAAKVPQRKIRRLYETDAKGIVDEEQIDEVGWALWDRCDSILKVTAAHYGRVRCLTCDTLIDHGERWKSDDVIHCPSCKWSLPWLAYHRTYRGKQLFGANAVDEFEKYHATFLKAQTPQAKMVLIDQLIHAFHYGVKELGRPAGVNLIEGSMAEVIAFLDALTTSGASATGLIDSRDTWRRTLATAPWHDTFKKNLSDE